MSLPRLEAAHTLHRFITSQDLADQESRQRGDVAPLTRELVLGCYRHMLILDWLLKKLADRKPDPLVRAFILPALYELLFLDGTPDHAVVHETIEGAKRKLKPGQLKFLNAILRSCCRQREDLLQQLDQAPAKIQRSHPPRLTEQWARHLSNPEIDAICRWNNSRAPICLRINPAHATAAEFVEQLQREDIASEVHPDYPETFVILREAAGITTLPGFDAGAFYVQDPSTIHAPLLLAAQPGERVLDLCAAPGGKTIMLAEAMQGQGTLLAVDKGAERVKLLKKNLSRMQQSWVKVLKKDAMVLKKKDAHPMDKFDAILLDTPCSNTGVLRRRPEARWRYSADSVHQLNTVQIDLLNVCEYLLKPGGRLVYSTCSLEPAENHELVARWIKTHPSYELMRSELILPGAKNCDGSFAALLRKK